MKAILFFRILFLLFCIGCEEVGAESSHEPTAETGEGSSHQPAAEVGEQRNHEPTALDYACDEFLELHQSCGIQFEDYDNCISGVPLGAPDGCAEAEIVYYICLYANYDCADLACSYEDFGHPCQYYLPCDFAWDYYMETCFMN